MDQSQFNRSRRDMFAGLIAFAVSAPFAAQALAQGGLLGGGLGSGLSGILGRASDSALDRLAVPGTFYNDPAVRIGLPVLGNAGGLLGGTGGALSSVLGAGSRLGLLDGFTRKLNDAAGLAANLAKPVFRSAISNLSLSDVPGIVSQNDGATQYLRRSAGLQLGEQVRPLIDRTLGQVGAFNQLDRLSARSGPLASLGLTRSLLGKSVTDQALNGIFSYIGSEEGRLRANPLGKAGGLLNGVLGR